MSEEGNSPKPSEKGDDLSPLASPPSQHQPVVGETLKWASPLWEEVGEISLRSCSPTPSCNGKPPSQGVLASSEHRRSFRPEPVRRQTSWSSPTTGWGSPSQAQSQSADAVKGRDRARDDVLRGSTKGWVSINKICVGSATALGSNLINRFNFASPFGDRVSLASLAKGSLEAIPIVDFCRSFAMDASSPTVSPRNPEKSLYSLDICAS